MGDLPRWASRFQFTRELWSDVDRLVLDPALERALASGELAAGDGPIFAELADALLPQDGSDARTWFLAERGRRVAEYARQRSGAVFADVREGVQLVGDESWRFAQCDLTGLLEDEQAGLTTPLADRVSPVVAAVLETLSEMMEAGRALALSVPSRAALKERGVSEEVFFDYLAEYFPQARVYGLADSPAVGIFDFGPVDEKDAELGGLPEARARTEVQRPVDELDYRQAEAAYDAELDAAEQTWSGEETEPGVEPEFEEGEVPIDYDNSLGELEPRYFAYLALVGVSRPPEGLTVVELSGDGELGELDYRGHEPSEERVGDASGLRAQLAEAQRQANLLAVERQGLLERLDDAQERIEELEDELEDLRDEDEDEAQSRTVSGEIETGTRLTPDELVGRLDAALAREQELRWRVTSLGAELEAAVARPVEELEAEVASLRAQLAAAAESSGAPEPAPATPAPARVAAESAMEVDPGSKRRGAELRAELDALLRKVERGGFNGVELHRVLRKIRDRLARA